MSTTTQQIHALPATHYETATRAETTGTARW